MFHSPSIATDRPLSTETKKASPIAGIAIALPVSLLLWAALFGAMRLCI